MEQQIIVIALTEITSRLLQCNSNGEEDSKLERILANIGQDMKEILETVPGKSLLKNTKELVSCYNYAWTRKAFVDMVNKLFLMAKEWATSTTGKWCIFVFCTAALIVFMLNYQPESVVAQWVTSLFQMLAGHLVSLGSTVTEKIGEFFGVNSLLEWLPTAESVVKVVAEEWVINLLNMLAKKCLLPESTP